MSAIVVVQSQPLSVIERKSRRRTVAYLEESRSSSEFEFVHEPKGDQGHRRCCSGEEEGKLSPRNHKHYLKKIRSAQEELEVKKKKHSWLSIRRNDHGHELSTPHPVDGYVSQKKKHSWLRLKRISSPATSTASLTSSSANEQPSTSSKHHRRRTRHRKKGSRNLRRNDDNLRTSSRKRVSSKSRNPKQRRSKHKHVNNKESTPQTSRALSHSKRLRSKRKHRKHKKHNKHNNTRKKSDTKKTVPHNAHSQQLEENSGSRRERESRRRPMSHSSLQGIEDSEGSYEPDDYDEQYSDSEFGFPSEDEDVNTFGLRSTSVTTHATSSLSDFQCLTQEGLLSRQAREVDDISEVLSMTGSAAGRLLRHFRWNRDRLFQKYLEDPAGVLKEAGISLSETYIHVEDNDTGHTNSPVPSPTRVSSCSTNQLVKSTAELECSICGELSVKYFSLPCKHNFCCDCWAQYLSMKIHEGEACISCPHYQCLMIVDDDSVKNLVSESTYARYVKFLLQSFVDTSTSTP